MSGNIENTMFWLGVYLSFFLALTFLFRISFEKLKNIADGVESFSALIPDLIGVVAIAAAAILATTGEPHKGESKDFHSVEFSAPSTEFIEQVKEDRKDTKPQTKLELIEERKKRTKQQVSESKEAEEYNSFREELLGAGD